MPSFGKPGEPEGDAGSRGTYVSLAAGKVQYSHRPPADSPAPSTGAPGVFDTPDPFDTSAAQTLQEINARISRPAYAWMVLVGGFFLGSLLLSAWVGFFLILGLAALVGTYF